MGIKEHSASALLGNTHAWGTTEPLAVSLCLGLTVQAWRAQRLSISAIQTQHEKSLLTFSVEWQKLCTGQDKLYRPEHHLFSLAFLFSSLQGWGIEHKNSPGHTNTSTCHVLKWNYTQG